MRPARALVVAIAALVLVAPAEAKKARGPIAPVAKRVEVVSTLHGDERRDAYRWLHERDSPAVRAYLDAENAYAAAVMKPRAKLIARLETELRARVIEDDADVPVRHGEWDHFTRHEQGKPYPIHMRRWRTADDAVDRVVLDLNLLAEGKPYLDLGVFEVSDDGRWLLYSLDESGDENYTLYVKDLGAGPADAKAGVVAPERIARVSGAAWAVDGKSFVYTLRDDAYRSYAVYCHELGGAAAKDRLLYEEKDVRFDLSVDRTRSGEWLVMHSASYESSEVRVARASRPGGPWRVVAARQPRHIYDLDHGGDTFYIRTNLDAPMFRVVAAPEDDPRVAKWKDVVAARKDVHISSADAFAGHLALLEREGGRPYVTLLDLASGARVRPAPPDVAWSLWAEANPDHGAGVYRYAIETFRRPAMVVEADFATGQLRVLKEPKVPGGYDGGDYATAARTATAPDGTEIPISLVWRPGVAPWRDDKPRPLLLEAYGAYGASYDADYDLARASLLDRGVVFAIAHVRGGGERGEPWHDAGKLASRLVSAGDFIAVAESLVRDGTTTRSQLAIAGVSAGGLLIGMVLNLRPELFRVAVLRVPFVDAVSSMLDPDLPLTTTEYEEWGDPRDPAQYAYMKNFDPYGNLSARAYPAILVESSFSDGRVMYFEQAKYVAKLRALKSDSRPLLLRTELHAGHGGASGRYARLSSTAFEYAFLLTNLGL